eukprot:529985-Pelagomonas_calceolata.AAC.4
MVPSSPWSPSPGSSVNCTKSGVLLKRLEIFKDAERLSARLAPDDAASAAWLCAGVPPTWVSAAPAAALPRGTPSPGAGKLLLRETRGKSWGDSRPPVAARLGGAEERGGVPGLLSPPVEGCRLRQATVLASATCAQRLHTPGSAEH